MMFYNFQIIRVTYLNLSKIFEKKNEAVPIHSLSYNFIDGLLLFDYF